MKDYLEVRRQYVIMHKVVKYARNLRVPLHIIDPYLVERQRLNKLRIKHEESIKAMFPPDSNILKLENGWYGVLVLNEKNKLNLNIELIGESGLPLVKRDLTCEKHINRVDFDNILPAILDNTLLEAHKEDIKSQAAQILSSEGYTPPEEPKVLERNSTDINVTLHAKRKYVNRILEITSDIDTNEYLRNNSYSVEDWILEFYNDSELIYTHIDDTEFYFTEDNVILVVCDKSIVTLYRRDFGFNRDINRMIVKEQLKVIHKVNVKYQIEKVNIGESFMELDSKYDVLQQEIDELESRILNLKSKQGDINLEKEESNTRLQNLENRLERECNKLFRR